MIQPIQSSNSPDLDIKVYARIIWHWAWLIVLCAISAAVAAYFMSSISIPVYQASATLLVNEGRGASVNMQDLLTSERIARTYSELIKRASTMEQVAARFNVEPTVLNDALTAVNVTPVRDTQLIRISIEGTSAQLVAAVADTLPVVFIEEIKSVQSSRFDEARTNLHDRIEEISQQIEQTQISIDRIDNSPTAEESVELNRQRSRLNQLQSNYNSLLLSLENLNLTAAQSSDSITVVEQPIIPSAPIRPRVLVNTLLAAVVGAMLALGVIFLIEYLDDRVKTPSELSQIVDAPVLGTITAMPAVKKQGWRSKRNVEERQIIAAKEPRHPITEAYRALRSNLQFASVDLTLDTLLVTSANASEGKTTTISNLAVVLAQSGKSVILVDCDLRRPRLHRVFDCSQSPGLTEAMLAEAESIVPYLHKTEVENLRIFPSGQIPPNPADLLGSKRMQRMIERMKEEADVILFDAPPLLVVTDAAILAQSVKGVVLVIDATNTVRTALIRSLDTLQRANANLFGIVINRLVRTPRSYEYYTYGSYYGKYEGDPVDEDKSGTSKTPLSSGKQAQASVALKTQTTPMPATTLMSE